jgi:AAA+ ATPase superfamily predicted ATPase
MRKNWGFFGRSHEIAHILQSLDGGAWFFCALTGRRRIGKTALINQALTGKQLREHLYVQIPDSDEHGVVQAFREAMVSYGWRAEAAAEIGSFIDIARAIRQLCETGWIVVIDEFQYFHRRQLAPFQSFLQAEVDKLRDTNRGGIFVLGSIQTEMTAILENRNAPLYSRITQKIPIDHWDFETLFEVFAAYGITSPKQQLFLWSLLEGVPKFYRDAFDAGALVPSENHRRETLNRLFFSGVSPLREEADTWFLRELQGLYEPVLKTIARLGPCSSAQLAEAFRNTGDDLTPNLSQYLKVLADRYGLIERRLPIFGRREDRKGRYVITDNFLTSWLGGLSRQVSASRMMPVDRPLAAADEALATVEGFTFEKMIRQITEECSRKGLGDFALTDFVHGYWNSADIEIDLVAVNDDDRIIRFGSCKRSADKHDTAVFDGHVERFLKTKDGRRFTGWTVQKALYAPVFDEKQRQSLEDSGYICRDLPYFRNLLSVKKG